MNDITTIMSYYMGLRVDSPSSLWLISNQLITEHRFQGWEWIDLIWFRNGQTLTKIRQNSCMEIDLAEVVFMWDITNYLPNDD